MFAKDQYELIDFGDGRKLERFGQFTLDRPCPAAEGFRPKLPGWQSDARRLSAPKAVWSPADFATQNWQIAHDRTRFLIKPTPAGHVGVFPEQAENWDWLSRHIANQSECTVLNLFAYTGGSTLAAASAGAAVVHVDASKSVVSWARQNAALSALQDAPIRWIVDDARKFVSREVRRDRKYDGIILDPPSYGHGKSGEPWKLKSDLRPLLEDCRSLMRESSFLLLTCHSEGIEPSELRRVAVESLTSRDRKNSLAKRLLIKSSLGASLDAGMVIRWPSN